MQGIIYLITNKINNKVYIGQTIQTLKRRWIGHCCKSSAKISNLSKAIQKYGKENFDIQILATTNSIDELNLLEIQFIKDYDCISPKGYNLCSGGLNGKKHPDTLKKLSIINKKRFENIENHGMYGKKHSKETKTKMSLARKGYVVSEITREKIGLLSKERMKNPKNHILSKIIMDEEYLKKMSDFQRRTPPVKGKKYKGVSFNKKENIYIARIMVNKKRVYLGTFKTDIECAIAYNNAVLKYFNGDGYLNVIDIPLILTPIQLSLFA